MTRATTMINVTTLTRAARVNTFGVRALHSTRAANRVLEKWAGASRRAFRPFARGNRRAGTGLVACTALCSSSALAMAGTISLCEGSSNYGNRGGNERGIQGGDLSALGGAFGIGTVSGFCAGFALRKIGSFAVILVGASISALQLASLRGYLTIHWDRVEEDVPAWVKDGNLMDPNILEKMGAFLRSNVGAGSTAGGFAAGFIAGLRRR